MSGNAHQRRVYRRLVERRRKHVAALFPAWAEQLEAALAILDQHDNTSGTGKRIPASLLGLDFETEWP